MVPENGDRTDMLGIKQIKNIKEADNKLLYYYDFFPKGVCNKNLK